jgi:Tfp pilus assembly protein PilX
MKLSHLKEERGFAMVTAIVLMALMFGLGLVALRAVDTNSNRTREQRVRESALALDEGVLYAQSLVLATKWANAQNP